VTGTWNTQARCLGAFIRTRRKLARLSLRQLAETTSLSNAYLSQLERGLHLPSVRVLKLLSEAPPRPSEPTRTSGTWNAISGR
jgi:transcriptional regulator with XRE-family HTH domain